MKRKVDVTPQARRDLISIISWYRESLGARASLKVAQTIQLRLRALEAGGVMGADLVPGSHYKRVVARKHVVIFLDHDDKLKVVRIVHGSQDLEAIAAKLDKE